MVYVILKAVTVETKRKLKWWQTTLIVSFIGFIATTAILLVDNLQLLHMLEYYVVGNLILITVIIDVLAFVFFYG